MDLAVSWGKTHADELGLADERVSDPLRIPDATIGLPLPSCRCAEERWT